MVTGTDKMNSGTSRNFKAAIASERTNETNERASEGKIAACESQEKKQRLKAKG